MYQLRLGDIAEHGLDRAAGLPHDPARLIALLFHQPARHLATVCVQARYHLASGKYALNRRHADR